MTSDAGPGRRGQDGFEFTYVLEPDDFAALIACQEVALKNVTAPPRARSRLLGIVLLWLMAVAGFVALHRSGILTFDAMAPIGAGMLVGACAVLVYQRWVYVKTYPRKLFELSRLAGREHMLTIGPAGLHSQIPGSVGHYQWSVVERIDDVSGHVFLWVSGLTALIVPDRAFADAAERTAFLSAVRQWSDGKN